jgi:hypothetical protein
MASQRRFFTRLLAFPKKGKAMLLIHPHGLSFFLNI